MASGQRSDERVSHYSFPGTEIVKGLALGSNSRCVEKPGIEPLNFWLIAQKFLV